jgi:hypothetical protein
MDTLGDALPSAGVIWICVGILAVVGFLYVWAFPLISPGDRNANPLYSKFVNDVCGEGCVHYHREWYASAASFTGSLCADAGLGRRC